MTVLGMSDRPIPTHQDVTSWHQRQTSNGHDDPTGTMTQEGLRDQGEE